MIEWSLFSYCWIGIMDQLIASDLLVGHPGGQLAVSAVLVALLAALVAHRRGVSGAAEWWWLLVGTIVNWLLLLPVGALGSTASVTALLPLPTGFLRNLLLYRWRLVPPLVLLWVLLGIWWLHRGRRFILSHSGGVLKGRPGNGDQTLLMVGITILVTLSGFFVQHYFWDIVGAAWWLFIVTLMVAYWFAVIFKWFWQLSDEEMTSWLSSIEIKVLSLGLVFALGTIFLIQQQRPPVINHPMVISHRGVNGNNGVPNTLQSLRRTAKLRPDRVETDVQLTRDNRFITYHDSNLYKMTGHRGTVRQATLKQLAHKTVCFGGYHAKLTPFTNYLRFSEQHHVPLIVELKAQKGVTPLAAVDRFQSQYGLGNKGHHFWIHTADLRIAYIVKKKQSHAKIGVVLPFVISKIPQNADFYCINYHMLNENLVNKLHHNHKKVYAWTVNRPGNAYRMKQMGVDGIITNKYRKILEISSNNKYILSNQVVGKLLGLF